MEDNNDSESQDDTVGPAQQVGAGRGSELSSRRRSAAGAGETPIQLAINQNAGGITCPIDVVLTLLWILAVAVILLIKPVWGSQPRPSVSAAVS